jgi:hypothetical protein
MAAMGFIEWRLLDTRGLPTLGVIQVAALFAGGLVISLGLLAGMEQAAGGIYLLTQLVAVVLFVARIWPTALRVPWLGTDAARHLGAASVWVVGALLLFMYLVFSFITAENPDDPAAFPLNVLIASDHATYIGVITNIVVALLVGVLLTRAAIAAWARHLVFWGLNLGLAVFVIGLIVDAAELKRVGAPVMGVTLLATLAILAWAAARSEPELAAEEAPPQHGG